MHPYTHHVFNLKKIVMQMNIMILFNENNPQSTLSLLKQVFFITITITIPASGAIQAYTLKERNEK